jgi:hypothetical protein
MPSFLIHLPGPLAGMVRSQTLSPARLIFLISLVVFFTALFIVAYVWMRKPDFGQHGGHGQPAVRRRTPALDGQPRVDTDSGSGETGRSNVGTANGLPPEDDSTLARGVSVS